MSRLLVAAFYAFTPLDDDQREALLSALPTQARQGAVLGSVLVAREGVNGTVSGPEMGVEDLLEHLQQQLVLEPSCLQKKLRQLLLHLLLLLAQSLTHRLLS